MSMALTMEGYSVSEAANGVEALALFSTNPFDLVITDFEMPAMKGDELVARIRQAVVGQPILMVSGNWSRLTDPLRQVNGCLDKPFKLADLITAVKRVLREHN